MSFSVTRLLISAWFCACVPTLSPAAIVHLTLDGDQGEFISQGQNISLTYDSDSGSTVQIFLTQPLGGEPSDLRFRLLNPVNVGGINAAGVRFRTTQLGTPLALGTFTGAMRAPFEPANTPGLSVEYDGRGANTSANGSFTISEFQLDGSGDLEQFSASFSYFADNNPNELRGTIAFGSATAVPEPSIVLVISVVAVGVVWRRRLTHRRTVAT